MLRSRVGMIDGQKFVTKIKSSGDRAGGIGVGKILTLFGQITGESHNAFILGRC